MGVQIYDSMSDINLAPADFITLMFDRTDEDGILYIPGWHYDRPGWEWGTPGSTDEYDSYRCCVDWNLAKYERLLKQFNELYSALLEMASYYDELDETLETAKKVLKKPELVKVWDIYIRQFDIGDIDYEKIVDINERCEQEAWVKQIARNIVEGKNLEGFEKEVLSDYIDIKITQQDIDYYNQYVSNVRMDVEQRIGKGLCEIDVILRAKRLYRLMSLGAPECIIYNEAKTLAAAMLLHQYGISREVVDNRIRLRLEMLEMMGDEELDELYRPRKMNGRKSLAPLFIYEILSKKSNSKKHLRQQDILKELEKYPYEISLERKAVGRMIQNLVDSQYGIYSDKTGVWMDKE